MRKQNYWSVADCNRIIEENKENASYYDRSISQDDMWEMLRFRMGFGEAETAVIIAALIKSGARFKIAN